MCMISYEHIILKMVHPPRANKLKYNYFLIKVLHIYIKLSEFLINLLISTFRVAHIGAQHRLCKLPSWNNYQFCVPLNSVLLFMASSRCKPIHSAHIIMPLQSCANNSFEYTKRLIIYYFIDTPYSLLH